MYIWRRDGWPRFRWDAEALLAPLAEARQKAVLNRFVLNRFMDGFEGNLTARKWASLGKCSVDAAQRDINDLLGRGLLARNPGGSRRTSYSVAGIKANPPSGD